ncbi:MAG TPA: hypothetical protein IAC64_03050 [Candidatus Caccomorpha excrementavium]|nr:hypothetical protein [Candidatus Caccomorpha excrementavium]
MGRNLIKLAAVCVVLALSVYLSAYAINEYSLAKQQEEKTIADALLQSQIQAELEKAQEEAREELAQAEIELTTEELTTKPAREEETEAAESSSEETSEEESTEEMTETEAAESTQPSETEASGTEPTEESGNGEIYEFDLARGSGVNPSGLLPESEEGIPVRTLFSLTDEEQEIFMTFLTEHYFLDGYIYAQQETDPYRKERKELAAGMEQYVIDSLYSVTEILPDLLSFSDFDLDVSGIMEENRERAKEFRNTYGNAGERGEEFGALYEEISDYFDSLDETLALMDEIFSEAAQSANPLLSAAVLLSRFQNELVPAVTEILDLGIGFKPYSNAIYLEGVEGVTLLSKEEAARVIANPGLALAAAAEEMPEAGGEMTGSGEMAGTQGDQGSAG